MFDFLSKKFSNIFNSLTGVSTFSEKNISGPLSQIEEALLEADVPYDVVENFVSEVSQDLLGTKVQATLKPAEHLMKIVHDKVLEFLGGQAGSLEFKFDIPSTIMVMGLQGAGKTTTISKLVYYIQKQAEKRGKKRSIVVGSVDFYRPAAVDQLQVLADKVNAKFYKSDKTDPILAARDIQNYAKQQQADILILDTAGRLHVDNTMLQELQQIDSSLNPKYKLLVIDAMTGQESLKVAQAFEEQVGFSGAVLTKMDSDVRAGIALAFKYQLKKPILFVATGEKPEDLEPFRADRITSRIVGMGDVKSLIEKAEEKIKKSEQESLYKSFSKGRITLQDFSKHIDMVKRLGSLGSVLKMIPGASGLGVSSDMLEKGELEMNKFKAIINSMTPKERLRSEILNSSRKKRVARGAGVSVEDVNSMLDRFVQSQKFIKQFKKFNKFKF